MSFEYLFTCEFKCLILNDNCLNAGLQNSGTFNNVTAEGSSSRTPLAAGAQGQGCGQRVDSARRWGCVRGTESPSPTTSPGGVDHLASGLLFSTDPFLFHSSCLSYYPKGVVGRVALGRARCPREHAGVQSTVLGDGRAGSLSGSAPHLLGTLGRGTVLSRPLFSYL